MRTQTFYPDSLAQGVHALGNGPLGQPCRRKLASLATGTKERAGRQGIISEVCFRRAQNVARQPVDLRLIHLWTAEAQFTSFQVEV